MLGYTEEDLNEMMNSLESVLTTVNPDDDPLLSGNLNMTLNTIAKYAGIEVG